MMQSNPLAKDGQSSLPIWTWLVPLPFFFIATLISLEAKITTGTSLFYFPLPFALTLTYWWGARVLPAYYINSVACAGLWGLERVELWPLYGLPEVVFVFLSWLFFVKFFSGKVWLPDTKQVIYFLIIGIILPLLIYKLLLELIFVLAGDAPPENYWNLFITTGFGDFISTFCLSIPLLYFFTRFMRDRSLVSVGEEMDDSPSFPLFSVLQWVELVVVTFLVYLVNNLLSFSDYWFLNGILSLYIAMRYGFPATVLVNSFILIITYVLPAASHEGFELSNFLMPSMLKTQLGTALLYVFTIITGRLVSDMRLTEKVLSDQNKDLNQMNKELDRFVYSVSHDLSAPLKSILGLVYISRLTNQQAEHRRQFDLIEKSANKLEHFVSEVLDYSLNKRTEIVVEDIDLKSLAHEVYDNLKFADGFSEVHFDFGDITHESISTDRSRLKIIFQNIFSNAIKFRRNHQQSVVKVSTEVHNESLMISIADNGQGIGREYVPRIFDMFFRGTDRAYGAGLGLYIAQEAAKAINARITVKSEYGEGSVFNVEFIRN
jgi:signal transduction histidine kinase